MKNRDDIDLSLLDPIDDTMRTLDDFPDLRVVEFGYDPSRLRESSYLLGTSREPVDDSQRVCR